MTKKYTAQFDEWFEAEKKKGLVDIKFFIDSSKDSTVEGIAHEALEILHSKRTSSLPKGF